MTRFVNAFEQACPGQTPEPRPMVRALEPQFNGNQTDFAGLVVPPATRGRAAQRALRLAGGNLPVVRRSRLPTTSTAFPR